MEAVPDRSGTATAARASAGAPFLGPPVAVAALVGVVLLLAAGGYGFHRDELYFIVAGRHPSWGYVDQPPLTPVLSALSVALLGLSPLAIRILPALEMSLIVLVTAGIAR